MKKTTILVDVQNIYYTTKQAYQCGFDYNVFWRQVTLNREIINAIAYTNQPQDKKQLQFQNILKAIGFELKLKPYIQRSDGSAKCDWDVGITIDALDSASNSEIIVLASGDGDFDVLVRKLINTHNIFIEIYGVPQLTANSLIQSASKFIPIEKQLLLKK